MDDSMKYRMSPNVAVRTAHTAEAIDFYSRVLVFSVRSQLGDVADIAADPLNVFVIEDAEMSGPVMELFVADLEAARDELVANGCELVRWRGKGQDGYIRDPFGVLFQPVGGPVPVAFTDTAYRRHRG